MLEQNPAKMRKIVLSFFGVANDRESLRTLAEVVPRIKTSVQK